ncbi:MAG: M23 family metallopeptidase [Vallitaleaceae bacterium]|nr:M23 family metallopeptidase [Vallitaleaceae bacterium]
MRRKNRVLEYIVAKKYYLSLIGCLIITLVAVGIIYNKDQQSEEIANLNGTSQEQSLVENPNDLSPIESEPAIDIIEPEPQISIHGENVPDITIKDVEDVTDNLEASISTEIVTTPLEADVTTEMVVSTDEVTTEVVETFNPTIEVQQPNLAFDVAQGMSKPINGDTLIAFSNTLPVYFKTLDQYKTSQGLFLAGEVGTEVKSVADGVVEKIDKGANKGNTITIYHGNGYKSMYAQLQEDINVKVGDLVNKGAIIGYLAQPTSYYALEGPHLYFEVIENGKPVDPAKLFQ